MAKKKTGGRKTGGAKKKGKSSLWGQLKKVFAGSLLLLAVVSVAGFCLFTWFPYETSVDKSSRVKTKAEKTSRASEKVRAPKKVPSRKNKTISITKKNGGDGKAPVYEVYTDSTTYEPDSSIKPAKVTGKPRVALIIDDIGYDEAAARKLALMDADLTFSMLPFSPRSASISRMLHGRGREIMLHLPMEPVEFPRVNPGPGALLTSMSTDVFLSQLEKDLSEIPYIVGVNNHMGSRLTADADRMRQVFTILKKKDLFFIDSYTTVDSRCMAPARLLRVHFARRDVFLDHVKSRKAVREQVRRLISIALRDGSAVGIGHPYGVTVDVLQEMLPELKSSVAIVPASKIVKQL